jgi:ankyrin repeat/SOCS box protein 13
VNAAKLHETALHHAAKVKNVDLIEMLVEFGGNIYARDNRGKKPSDYTWSSSAPAKCFEYYESEPAALCTYSCIPSCTVTIQLRPPLCWFSLSFC